MCIDQIERSGGVSLRISHLKDILWAIASFKRANEMVVAFFHATNRTEIGRVYVNDKRAIGLLIKKIFPDGTHPKDDCVLACSMQDMI